MIVLEKASHEAPDVRRRRQKSHSYLLLGDNGHGDGKVKVIRSPQLYTLYG